MIKRIFCCLAFLLCSVVCYSQSGATKYDTMLKRATDSIMSQFWRMHPDWAISVGNHKYDALLEAPTPKWLAQRNAYYRGWYNGLKAFDGKELSPASQMDLDILRNQFKYLLWRADTLKVYNWNPAEYNVCGSFDNVLNNPDKTLEQRLRAINRRLTGVPDYYAAAKKNITRPTREHLEMAIVQHKGCLAIFEKQIPDSAASLSSTGLKDSLQNNLRPAIAAINDYIAFLETYKANPNAAYRDFRIGTELYKRKFAYEMQTQSDAEATYQKALLRKKQVHDEMRKLAVKLWPKYYGKRAMPDHMVAIRMLIDTIASNHCKPDQLISCVKTMLPKQKSFVEHHNIISLDHSKPLYVKETPYYLRGSGAGAYLSNSGPYSTTDYSFYYVTPLDNYSEEDAIDFMREYNNYTLQILNIHEAIPGHYTQQVYANTSPSIVKSVFDNKAMIEGWAVYAERMMLEEGYENSDEMWLMYYKWHLRSVINALLDYQVHNTGITSEQAMDLMIKEGFQQRTEAQNKWKRATLSQVQLATYFGGYSEIYDLREEMKRLQGKEFNLQKFHEKFLSYGSAPVKHIRMEMLAEIKK